MEESCSEDLGEVADWFVGLVEYAVTSEPLLTRYVVHQTHSVIRKDAVVH